MAKKHRGWLSAGILAGLVFGVMAYGWWVDRSSGVAGGFGALTDNLIAAGSTEAPVENLLPDRSLINLNSLAEFGLTDLVGTASTSFNGSSADRIQNIRLGAAKLSGVVIAPGEEFSAVEAIGEVTKELGYTEEFVIKDGESKKELGGGLCQIATTLFRAIIDAGLPVTERVNHSYVVGYYGPGLDATIYGPHPDLKFVNDTKNYIVIKGEVVGDRLVFEFYGQKDGRMVTISKPELTDEIEPPPGKIVPTFELAPGDTFCTERERKGLTAEVLYSVTYPSGETKNETFKSVYRPWQKVCFVGVEQ